MVRSHVDVATRSHDYGDLDPSKAKGASDILEPLHIERQVVEPIPRIPKGSKKCSTVNPNARAARNYSIVKDLA